jgi:ABC-2 type transport system permease protein
MIEDITTILWKEYKELFAKQGVFRGNVMALILSFGVLGVYLPLLGGRAFVESPIILLFYVWFPMFMVINMVMDSFAGERERHTLETLLASRLPDHTILLGKMAAVVLYGSGITIACLLVGLLLVNVVFWSGPILVFPPVDLALLFMASLLINTLVSSAGVLISLTSKTVRIANDTLIGTILAVAVIPIGVYSVIPSDWKAWIANSLFLNGIIYVLLAAVILLIVLDAIMVAVVLFRFQRSRLIAE